MKGDSKSETILTQLVSHSHRVKYLGGVSQKRLYMADDMIRRRSYLGNYWDYLVMTWFRDIGQ